MLSAVNWGIGFQLLCACCRKCGFPYQEGEYGFGVEATVVICRFCFLGFLWKIRKEGRKGVLSEVYKRLDGAINRANPLWMTLYVSVIHCYGVMRVTHGTSSRADITKILDPPTQL